MSHNISEMATRIDDALLCREAALLLRAGEASPDGEDLGPPIDRLLSAVGRELETDRALIPETVRSAAVELAAHLVQRTSVPVPGGSNGGAEPARHALGGRRRPAAGARRRTAPFTPSIRLGRMG